jgi:aryl-alcohol dehydrogenase-like predicted oxidoreductase
MKYRALGRTGILVSEIGFGAWGIGGRTAGETSYGDTDDGTSLSALARALDRGITFFDTSSAYGNGHSESLIGRALRSTRQRVVIASKAGYGSWDHPPDFSPTAIIRSAEASLARLRTDYIDLLQLHNAPLEVLKSPATRQALGALQKAGKIRAWGASTKSPADALEAIEAVDVSVVQANFNMMDLRAVSSGLLDAIRRSNTGFIARTPLCFGFLSGAIDRSTVFPPGDHRLSWSRAQRDNWIDGAKELLTAVAALSGPAPVANALRFCLSFDGVSSVIPGILTPHEAEEDALASDLGPLSKEAVSAVLRINSRRQFFVAPPRATQG